MRARDTVAYKALSTWSGTLSLFLTTTTTFIIARNSLTGNPPLRDFLDALPPELGANILAYTLSWPWPALLEVLRITRVCRRWRDFAYSVPLLWASVTFCPGHNRDSSQLALIGSWLARSQSVPLRIRLIDRAKPYIDVDEDPDTVIDRIVDIINAICVHAGRIHTLDLEISEDCWLHKIWESTASELAQLQHLRVWCDRNSDGHRPNRLHTSTGVFNSATQLTSFEGLFYSKSILFDRIRADVQWAQLTSI